MTVTSATQTQYTTSLNTRIQDTFPYDEVAKKQHPSRYETLLDMNYNNMSEVERRELSYYSARRPMDFLDEEGNRALNKALEGKTDEEMFMIKGILGLEFMTNTKMNAQGGLDRQKFDSIDTSKNATIDRFEIFIEESKKNGNVDNVGLIDIMGKFLNIYKNEPSDYLTNQEDSVVDDFFEDLYSKESINFTSSMTKQDMQDHVKEYAAFLEQELGSSEEAKNTIVNLMTEFKTALMDELEKNINSTSSTVQERQSSMKVLVDEKKSEKESSLTTLIGVDKGKSIPTVEELLDEEGMAHLNESLSDMSEEDQIMIKLVLSFQLSIKSENVVDGKLKIEFETGQLDTKDILKKLDLMIAKRKDRKEVNPIFTENLDYIVDELKTFYTNKSEMSSNSINKKDL